MKARPSSRERAAAQKPEKMLDVLGQFRVVVGSIRSHYQAVERRAHVSGAQLWALAEVASHPGMQVGQLARRLGIHQSTASNLLKRLEDIGLITRQRGADQRQVRLAPTKKGLRVLQRAPQPPVGVLQQALSELPPARLKALHANLSALIRLMQVKNLQARSTPLSDM